MKSDMNYYYIKNAKKVMVNEVILYVPKAYEVMYETDIEQEFKDSTTGEKIVIKYVHKRKSEQGTLLCMMLTHHTKRTLSDFI